MDELVELRDRLRKAADAMDPQTEEEYNAMMGAMGAYHRLAQAIGYPEEEVVGA